MTSSSAAPRRQRSLRPEASPGAKPAYRPDIDGLRALAVLAVVGFHAFPRAFPGGFAGVDVFFVISGYLISTLLIQQLQTATFSLGDFYRRRALRILPALIIVLAACLGFGWYALLPEEFRYVGKQVAAASVFVSNFTLWDETGYFAPATQLKPLLHLWSLGIEEQFYLCWPVVLMLLARRRRSAGLVIATLTAASFVLDVVLVRRDATAAFYLPLARFWELGLGCLVAWMQERRLAWLALQTRAPWTAVRAVVPVAGVALILTAILCLDAHVPYPGWATLIPTAGALCVVIPPGDTWLQRRIMAHPALVFVGLISYPLYLWHWPILSFAAILKSGTPDIVTRTACVLLSVLLAVATYRCIERPIRRHSRSLRISSALVSPVALVGAAGFIVFAAAGFAHRFDAHVLAVRATPKTDPLCRQTVESRIPFNYCKRTDLRQPEVLFLGDSQTEAIYDGTVAALGDSYPLMLLGRGGCPPVLNVHVEGVYRSDSNQRSCNATWRSFVRYVRQTKPRVVVLVGDGTRFFDGATPAASDPENDLNVRQAAFKHGLADLLAQIRTTSRVVYVREIPEFDSAPSCYLRPIRLPGSKCSAFVARGALELRRSAYTNSLEDVQDEFPGLVLIDPIPVLCNARYCPQELRSGELLYRDEMHLSEAGGRRVVRNSGLVRLIRDSILTPG